MCWKMLCCMAKTCYLEEVRDVEKMLVLENALHYGLDFLFGASKAEMLKKCLCWKMPCFMAWTPFLEKVRQRC